MPTYVYELLDEKGEGTGERFEYVAPMSAPDLTKHPETGQACRKVPAAFAVAGDWSDIKSKSKLSNSNLERLGFTKYERKGEGYMERVAGKEGPKSISADE